MNTTRKLIAILVPLFLVGILIFAACAGPSPPAPAPAPTPAPAPSPAPAPPPAPTPQVKEEEKAPEEKTEEKVSEGKTGVSADIKDFTFLPDTITVSRGTTVTWTNRDAVAHTATGDDFDSGNLATGQSWSYTFNTAGTFAYICTIHPSMHGEVVLVE